MSDTETSTDHKDGSAPQDGILAALPRRRPQRASPRRAAARAAAQTTGPTDKTAQPTAKARTTKQTADKARTAKQTAKTLPAESESVKPKRPVRPRTNSKPVEPPAPRQGYEPEEELELGGSVNPPSGAELVESVADIVGELAGSGLAAGGRLLKDAFSLLRRP